MKILKFTDISRSIYMFNLDHIISIKIFDSIEVEGLVHHAMSYHEPPTDQYKVLIIFTQGHDVEYSLTKNEINKLVNMY